MSNESGKGLGKATVERETVINETLERFLDFSIESAIEALGQLGLTNEEISQAIRNHVEEETTQEAIKKTKDNLAAMASPKHQAQTEEMARKQIGNLDKGKPKAS